MTWLVLRLHRPTLLMTAGVTASAVAALAIGRALSVAALRRGGLPDACFTAVTEECRRQAVVIIKEQAGADGMSVLGSFPGVGRAVLVLLPLVLGVLAGAGLVSRELDRGTHLLGLTQGISRARWWGSRLAVIAPVPALAALVVAAVAGWAYAPLEALRPLQTDLGPPLFESAGVVPAGYALLAFAVAAVVGMLTRSAAVAVLVTCAVFMATMITLSTAARQTYLPTVTLRVPLPADVAPGWSPVDETADWVIDRDYLDSAGRPVPVGTLQDAFDAGGCTAMTEALCLERAGVEAVEVGYHPADRFWPFQLIETTLLLALSAGVIALGSLRLRRSMVP